MGWGRSEGRAPELGLPAAPVLADAKAEAAVATEAAVAAVATEAAEVEVGEAVKAGEEVKEAGLREVVAGGRMQLLCLAMLCFGLGAWMMVGRRVLTLSLRLSLSLSLRLRLRLSLRLKA